MLWKVEVFTTLWSDFRSVGIVKSPSATPGQKFRKKVSPFQNSSDTRFPPQYISTRFHHMEKKRIHQENSDKSVTLFQPFLKKHCADIQTSCKTSDFFLKLRFHAFLLVLKYGMMPPWPRVQRVISLHARLWLCKTVGRIQPPPWITLVKRHRPIMPLNSLRLTIGPPASWQKGAWPEGSDTCHVRYVITQEKSQKPCASPLQLNLK